LFIIMAPLENGPRGSAATAAAPGAAAVAISLNSTNDSPTTVAMAASLLQVPEASLYPVGHDSYTADDLYKEHRQHVNNNNNNVSNGNNNNNNNSNLTFNGMQRPTQLIAKWPTELTRLMSINMDDEWPDVMDRIVTHPDEIIVQGINGGLNALHVACLRYPPTHVVQALINARPDAARMQNFNGETPLHIASYGSTSCSEEVQRLLIDVAPEMAAVSEQNGDTALHFAARSGATLQLMERLLQAAPQCIAQRNARGMHPFWLLPRRFLEANDMDEILNENNNGGEYYNDDHPEYRDDWDALVLFLKYSYQYNIHGNSNINTRQRQEIVIDREHDNDRNHYRWVVHAAAATPSCPREVLAFLCRMYPEQALVFNENGYTPLLLAVRTTPAEMQLDEPSGDAWDENEDGFRQRVDAATGELHNRQHDVAEEEVALSEGDSDFIAQAIQGRRRPVVSSSSSSSSSYVHDSTSSPEAAASDDDENDHSQPPFESSEQHSKPTVVEILLEWSPKSACVADEHSQRLPLAHALLSGHSWKTIRSLIAVFPRAINTRDPSAAATGAKNGGVCSDGSGGLYMFQLAAMASPDLDSVYLIVRSLPQLVETGRQSCSTRRSPPKAELDAREKASSRPARKKPKLA
jgi:ankyrin repeat protein